MKFSLNQKELLPPLSLISDFTSKVSISNQVGSCNFKVNGNQLTISGYDEESYFQQQITCISLIEIEFNLASKSLFQFVAQFNNLELYFNVVVNDDEIKQVIITCAEYEIILPVLNTTNGLMSKKELGEVKIKMDSNSLKNMFKRLKYCIIEQKVRRNLSGVNIRKFEDKWYFVGTDSYRISFFQCQLNETVAKDTIENIILPVKAMQEINKLLEHVNQQEIIINFDRSSFSITSDTSYFLTNLIADTYPDISLFFNNRGTVVMKVAKNVLLDSLRVFKNINEFGSNLLNCQMENSTLQLSYKDSKSSLKKTIPIEINQDKFQINFNINFLYECVSSSSDIYSDVLQFEFTDEASPVRIGDELETNYTSFIMPQLS